MIGLRDDEKAEVTALDAEATDLTNKARIARARRRLLLERGRQRAKRLEPA